MELATADAVQPHEGEAAFILQLRPPATADADELASGLDRFTSLFLERAVSDRVRFSPLGALTWALCAPVEHVEDVDAACDELADTLFGDPASEAVHLARQPDVPRKDDYRIQDQALSDEEGEAVMQEMAEHEWDMEDASEPAPVNEAAGADLDDATIDIDAFNAAGEDDWDIATPIEEDPVIVLDDDAEPEPESEGAFEHDAEPGEDASASLAEDSATFGEDIEPEDEAEAHLDMDAADEPLDIADPVEGVESELEVEHDLSPADDGSSEVNPEDGFELAGQAEPATEALEDGQDEPSHTDDAALESPDAMASELGTDLAAEDDFVLGKEREDEVLDIDALASDSTLEEALDEINATSRIWDENADTVDIDDIAASALHENRLGSQVDIAAELSAFREEMKAIAQSIPSGGMDAALADFRAGLETLSGEIGQRVDGAAQRIEAAVGQLDVSRYDAASLRVESAAALMETSVQEALKALTSASSAMATPSASELFEEKDRDSV